MDTGIILMDTPVQLSFFDHMRDHTTIEALADGQLDSIISATAE